jgi:dihydroxyacetone kinase
MLLRAAQSLQNAADGDLKHWARAALEACQAVGELGGAMPGDRTMLDALLPFATELNAAVQKGSETSEALAAAVKAAEAGAESTSSMVPRRGRASYLGTRVIGHPDPGAVAVSIWLRAIEQSL